MPLRAYIAAVVLALSCTGARAGTVALGEALNTLYRIDLTARTAQAVGPAGLYGSTPISSVEGLTYSPDGKLYAASDNIKGLLRISPDTGAATYIGSLGLTGQGAGQNDNLDLSMAFTCDGKLWLASGSTNKFYAVNPATGATTYIGNLGVTITGLVSRNGTLYGAGSRTTPFLYVIDTATAHATSVGSYGSSVGWITTVSPGFDSSGQLWAMLNNVPPGPGVETLPLWSDLATISSGGALNDLGPVTGPPQKVGITGLAFGAPVCAAQGDSTSIQSAPAGSPLGTCVLIALLGLAAGTTLRARHPSAR